MTIWLISDTHFSHENIIRFCDRPFANSREMDEKLIEWWNQFVQLQDHVYHLGDVTTRRGGSVEREWFVRLIKRLNGHKRLILGNHDHFPTKTYLDAGFEKIRGTGQWLDGLLLSHYPIHPLSLGRAKACVHGHIHQNPSPTPHVIDPITNGKRRVQPYVNVCVEATNYHPISLEEVKDRVDRIIKEQNGEDSQVQDARAAGEGQTDGRS